MLKRICLCCVWIYTLFVNGCAVEELAVPEIVGTASYAIVKPVRSVTTYPPRSVKPSIFGSVPSNLPVGWLPPGKREKSWKAIVIHHSGTKEGNAAIFDKWHRNSNHWQGVGYDFVIGNGRKCSDGRVEVTFRWKQQIPGAHVGGTPNNWANADGIGICLVGDFNKTRPTGRQMQSLVRLVRFLQKRYRIPSSRIYGHRDTPGYTGVTQCPGRDFSISALRRML